jgi:hypothetical protein
MKDLQVGVKLVKVWERGEEVVQTILTQKLKVFAALALAVAISFFMDSLTHQETSSYDEDKQTNNMRLMSLVFVVLAAILFLNQQYGSLSTSPNFK